MLGGDSEPGFLAHFPQDRLGGRLVEFRGSTRDFPVQRTVAVLDEQHAPLLIQNHCPRRRAPRRTPPQLLRSIHSDHWAHYSDRPSTNRRALRVALASDAFHAP